MISRRPEAAVPDETGAGRRTKLLPDALNAAVAELPDWALRDGKLHREYKFIDFTTAFAFMAGAATVAEKMDHHPEWSNVYGRVIIDLWTHSSGGITPTDFMLASRLEKIASKLL